MRSLLEATKICQPDCFAPRRGSFNTQPNSGSRSVLTAWPGARNNSHSNPLGAWGDDSFASEQEADRLQAHSNNSKTGLNRIFRHLLILYRTFLTGLFTSNFAIRKAN